MAPAITRVLTIAGSDSGGGAGIQADLKTFAAFGVYGMTVITAVTAQNTMGIQQSFSLPLHVIEAQLRSVVSDIGVDAVKTGMLASTEATRLVCDLLEEVRLPNLVVDPVMSAKDGHTLLPDSALDLVRRRLLPLATVVTPNLDEASALLGRPIRTVPEMGAAVKALLQMGAKCVVVKGGHLSSQEEAVDVAGHAGGSFQLRSLRIATRNTHGTGCTFSAAITAGLGKGEDFQIAIHNAKEYISKAIEGSMDLGLGHGPVDHLLGKRGL